MEIKERFPSQFNLLKDLFGEEQVLAKVERLNSIFLETEAKWQENLNRLERTPVKYLLLAEAPPWTERGEVRYFYNTFKGNWVRSIWRAFSPTEELPSDVNFGLGKLADKGFLLIDTLPFAMKYPSTKRRSPLYQRLVAECIPFLTQKIRNHNIIYL